MHKKFHYILGSIYLLLFIGLALLVYLNFQNEPISFSDWKWLNEANLQELIIEQRQTGLTDFFMTFTGFFGEKWGIFTAAFSVLIVLIFKKKVRWLSAFYLMLMLAVSTGINVGLKLLIDRTRPDVAQLATETSKSFPSGHTIFATVLFWGLFLIAVSKMKYLFPKVLLAILALAAILLVMLSRIYLGVHYPSDTFGSVLLGMALLHLTYPMFYKFSHPQKGRHQR